MLPNYQGVIKCIPCLCTSIYLTFSFFRSSEYQDEMCVSAALLHQATNNQQYLTDAVGYYNSSSRSALAYDWDNKIMLCNVKYVKYLFTHKMANK
jgi:hypothetical protein